MINSNIFRSIFAVALVSVLSWGCGSNTPSDFQLKGKLSNSSGGFISLVNINSSQLQVVDSAEVNEDGEFIFLKKVPEKGFYSLQFNSSNFATLILDSTEKAEFEGNAIKLSEGYTVKGSKDSEIMIAFNEQTRKNFSAMEKMRYSQDSIRNAFQSYLNAGADSTELDSISNALEPVFDSLSAAYTRVMDETQDLIRQFIDNNLQSFSVLAAVQMLSMDQDLEYYIKVADSLSAAYPQVANLKNFKAYVDSKKTTAIGMLAPEITMNDVNGQPISLSSLKGKVVLVDFWAAWCKPCRAENPFVVSLYHKYKDKGMDIFSVSLDQNKGAWVQAIAQDKLVWKNHVSDLKQWQSPVVQLYQFEAIPFTCILDREGKIVAKNLRGPQLEAKIKELLGVL